MSRFRLLTKSGHIARNQDLGRGPTGIGTTGFQNPSRDSSRNSLILQETSCARAVFQNDLVLEHQFRKASFRIANAAVKLAPNRDGRAMAALALARAGDTAGAEKLVGELDKAFPLDTLVQGYWLPTIRAAIALQRKDPNDAIELLKGASMIELCASRWIC